MGQSFEAEIAALTAKLGSSSPDRLIALLAAELVSLKREHAALVARIGCMETLQTLTDNLAAAGRGELFAPLPSAVVIDASHSFHDTDGFYKLEYDADGRAYRWTGPSALFSLPLFIERSAGAAFALEFGYFYTDADVAGLRALVDGQPIDATVSPSGNGYEITGSLPPRTGTEGSVLTFILPQVASPLERGEDDPRVLGLTFRSLRAVAHAAAHEA